VNARASNGLMALHLCAGNLGRHEHLALLLKAGADVNVCTDTSHSALDIAYQIRDLLKGMLMGGNFTGSNNNGKLIGKPSDLCDAILVPNTRMKIIGVRGVSLGNFDDPGSPLEKIAGMTKRERKRYIWISLWRMHREKRSASSLTKNFEGGTFRYSAWMSMARRDAVQIHFQEFYFHSTPLANRVAGVFW
jgi:hypothetical protein